MSSDPTIPETKLLPDANDAEQLPAVLEATALATGIATVSSVPAPATPSSKRLADLPRDELEALAEEFGLDAGRFKSRPELVAGIHQRRQLIASMDRDAMLDVVRWGRRPVTWSASKEQLALEIARIRSMRFSGLSQRGLVVLAQMRDIDAQAGDPVPALVRRLKKQESFFSRMNRKRRSMLGSIVSNILGEDDREADYQYLPPPTTGSASNTAAAPGRDSIKDEIEDSGLFGGIANRVKKTADSYINTKLDEIESRIDRKLDEIDRRLAEWRDKEIANRIRILKITLWASVIVGAFSALYSYLKVYFIK